MHFDLYHQKVQYFMNRLTRLTLLFALATLGSTCHYSCSSCTGPQYISCLNCTSKGTFTVVQNTTETPSIYWASVYNTGTCLTTLPSSANTLGIAIIVLVIIVALFFRTKQTFYLLFTLQTYGLNNLVEVAWVNPIGYVLQGLQYFMVFNTMDSKNKTQDYLLVASKNYRIHSFLGTTNISQNGTIIAPFTLIGVVVLIVIALISLRKKKQPSNINLQQKLQEGNEQFQSSKRSELNQNGQNNPQEQKQCCDCWRTFTEQVLIKISKFLLTLLFLNVQQTMLVLLVTLVYQVPVNTSTIALSIAYLHILLFVMTYCYYYRIEYFKQKKLMYLTFAQKIIMPIMVVIPIKYQFIFFAFAIGFVIAEFIFDKINGFYDSFSRLAIYKIVEAMTVLGLTAYFIVQKSVQSYSSSQSAAIAATFFICLNLFLFFVVELPLSIKQKYFPKKEQQANKNQLLPNETMNTIAQKEQVEEEPVKVLDLENDLENDSGDEDGNKMKREEPTIDGNSVVAEVQHYPKIQKKEQEKPPEPKPSPPKKRRKQIIDPELRLRYGI